MCRTHPTASRAPAAAPVRSRSWDVSAAARPCPCPRLVPFRAGHYRRQPLQYFVICRSVGANSTDRADLEQLAVITGLERNAELTTTIVPGHDRRHGDDGFTPGVVERRLHGSLLAELDQ